MATHGKRTTLSTPARPDYDCRELIAAFTDALNSPRPSVPAANANAVAAAAQYREIRAALRTHAEPVPTQPGATVATAAGGIT